jgi:hypothetical protein
MITPTTPRRPLVRTTIDIDLERPERRDTGIFRGWGVTLTSNRPF